MKKKIKKLKNFGLYIVVKKAQNIWNIKICRFISYNKVNKIIEYNIEILLRLRHTIKLMHILCNKFTVEFIKSDKFGRNFLLQDYIN